MMTQGQRLFSADRSYFATLDNDGNFAVYRSSDGACSWSTNTTGSKAISAHMLRDGRFVLRAADGEVLWSTPTRGRHHVFGVSTWGTAIVIDARRWKPRRKLAEPFVEGMLRKHGAIQWQSTSFNKPPKWRQK
jgi:hypothetical protein